MFFGETGLLQSKVSTLLIFLIGASYSISVRADSKKHAPPTNAFGGHLSWGSCALEKDPKNEKSYLKVWPILCLRPKVSSQFAIREDDGEKNTALNYTSLYSGLHLHQYVSMHGEWIRKRFFQIGDTSDQKHRDIVYTKNAFVQIGNVGLHRVRTSVGKVDHTFGVNHQALPEIYNSILKEKKYWRGPKWGGRVTYDSLVSAQYDMTYTSNKFPGKQADEDKDKPTNEALSFRSMYDIAALDGFRFVFSGYGETAGMRRIGAGFITVSQKNDTTVFEWIRERSEPDGEKEPFDQFFRLSHTGGYRHGNRWVAEYESDRFGYRLGTVGMDLRLPDYGTLRVAVSYHDAALNKTNDYLLIVTAVQLSL